MGTKMNLSDRIKENIENMGAAGESIASCLDIKSKVDCLPLPNQSQETLHKVTDPRCRDASRYPTSECRDASRYPTYRVP